MVTRPYCEDFKSFPNRAVIKALLVERANPYRSASGA